MKKPNYDRFGSYKSGPKTFWTLRATEILGAYHAEIEEIHRNLGKRWKKQ